MNKVKLSSGKIIILYGAHPEKHELDVANIFTALGKDVEFLPPSYAKGVFSPDIQMDGQIWEIKSPDGNSKRTIENNYRKAQKQSENIIFDLRRIGMDEKIAISQIKRVFLLHRSGKMRRTRIITKNNKLLDFE